MVENELVYPATMPAPLAEVLAAYYTTLDGDACSPMANRSSKPSPSWNVASGPTRPTPAWDEYQDANPAQERLIRLLVGPATQLCVVGDDHQAIYQWRGSDASNIVPGRRPRTRGGGLECPDREPTSTVMAESRSRNAQPVPRKAS